MHKLRILYVATEVAPYLQRTAVAELLRSFAAQVQPSQGKDMLELRILVPRFGVIGERRNRLHEVLRVSGTHITVGVDECPLTLKVSSIPGTRIQAYFVDSDVYFHRREVWSDRQGKFYEDNDERMVFFCKSVLETVQKLEWTPDIVHCHDWFSALLPIYLRNGYGHIPFFQRAKIVLNVYNTHFAHTFSEGFIGKIGNMDFPSQVQDNLRQRNYLGLIGAAAHYADHLVQAEPITTPAFTELLARLKPKSIVGHDAQAMEEYMQLYQSIYSFA